MTVRSLERIIASQATSDGAGVKLRRSLGASPHRRHDPFLMLDEFLSDDPDDYIGGFPAHPHRGFETVTYMLHGRMRHQDSNGNEGDLGPGDVQWMTAACGIIHSEMPQQSEGRMRGFQLWLNLPAAEKLRPADWRDIPAASIPVAEIGGGVRVKVIAGTLEARDDVWRGPAPGRATEPMYLDVHLPVSATVDLPVPHGHNAFVYPYDGDVAVGEDAQGLPNRAAGLLSGGDTVRLASGPDGARVLLLAGKPINEPIVQHGPFVMNTREEIEQAIAAYQNGTLTGVES